VLSFTAFLEAGCIRDLEIDSLIDGFCDAIGVMDLPAGVVGGMDLWRPGEGNRLPDTVRMFAKRPDCYEQLENRFDALHRVLIGPSQLCDIALRGLDGAATVRRFGPRSLVVVDEDIIHDPRAKDAAADAFVQISEDAEQ